MDSIHRRFFSYRSQALVILQQLCGDYFINHEIRISSLNNQESQMVVVFCFFFPTPFFGDFKENCRFISTYCYTSFLVFFGVMMILTDDLQSAHLLAKRSTEQIHFSVMTNVRVMDYHQTSITKTKNILTTDLRLLAFCSAKTRFGVFCCCCFSREIQFFPPRKVPWNFRGSKFCRWKRRTSRNWRRKTMWGWHFVWKSNWTTFFFWNMLVYEFQHFFLAKGLSSSKRKFSNFCRLPGFSLT